MRCLPKPMIAVWLGSVLILLSQTAIAETKIYRYTDDKGNVVFSEKPPADKRPVEEVKVEGSNQLDTKTIDTNASQFGSSGVEGRTLHKISQREALLKQIQAAKRDLDNKKQALAQGKEPRPGELQGTVTGTRLRPEYFERIKKMEQDVEQASATLDKLHATLRKLK